MTAIEARIVEVILGLPSPIAVEEYPDEPGYRLSCATWENIAHRIADVLVKELGLADLTAALERVEKLASGDYCSWMGGTDWISRRALRDALEGK